MSVLWVFSDRSLSSLIDLWPRKMKIDCSRQTWTEHTNERRSAFLELLSEPKMKMYYKFLRVDAKLRRVSFLLKLIFKKQNFHRFSIEFLCSTFWLRHELKLSQCLSLKYGNFVFCIHKTFCLVFQFQDHVLITNIAVWAGVNCLVRLRNTRRKMFPPDPGGFQLIIWIVVIEILLWLSSETEAGNGSCWRPSAPVSEWDMTHDPEMFFSFFPKGPLGLHLYPELHLCPPPHPECPSCYSRFIEFAASGNSKINK